MTCKRTNLPCPVCGSKDAGAIYKNADEKGDFYMFTCYSGKHEGKRNYRINNPDNYYFEMSGEEMEEEAIAQFPKKRVVS